MCDHGRLNFHYLESESRLKAPAIKGASASWTDAIKAVVSQLKGVSGAEIAIVASGKMTNEELWLARKIAEKVGTTLVDIVPNQGEGDTLLLSADRNPNTAGAQLLGVATGKLAEIATAVQSRKIKTLLVLGEDAVTSGIDLGRVESVIALNILPNSTTNAASVLLPGAGFAEKRGSMVNKSQRLQRLNQAVQAPGEARDDWEILADILKGLGGEADFAAIEDVFKQIAAAVPAFAGLTISRIGDLGVQLKP
jgi:NADH-quinone oxidoreductase subunit G